VEPLNNKANYAGSPAGGGHQSSRNHPVVIHQSTRACHRSCALQPLPTRGQAKGFQRQVTDPCPSLSPLPEQLNSVTTMLDQLPVKARNTQQLFNRFLVHFLHQNLPNDVNFARQNFGAATVFVWQSLVAIQTGLYQSLPGDEQIC
jgi:hypothetical protein